MTRVTQHVVTAGTTVNTTPAATPTRAIQARFHRQPPLRGVITSSRRLRGLINLAAMAGFIGTSLCFTPLVVRHPAVRRRSRPPPSSSSPLLVSLSDCTTIGAFAYGALAVLSSAALPAAALSPLPLPMMGGGTSPPTRSPPPHSRAIASKILPEMSYTTSTSRPPPRSRRSRWCCSRWTSPTSPSSCPRWTTPSSPSSCPRTSPSRCTAPTI